MLTKEEVLTSKEFLNEYLRTQLYNEVENYLEKSGTSKIQFSKELGVTKGYLSQVLNGNSDHRLSKLIDMSLAIGKVPYIYYKDKSSVKTLIRNNRSTFIDFEQLEEKVKKQKRALKTIALMFTQIESKTSYGNDNVAEKEYEIHTHKRFSKFTIPGESKFIVPKITDGSKPLLERA